MSYGTAAAQPAPQLVVPAHDVVMPDVAALERAQLAGRSIVVRPGVGWISGPSASISVEPHHAEVRPSWITGKPRAALNTSFSRS